MASWFAFEQLTSVSRRTGVAVRLLARKDWPDLHPGGFVPRRRGLRGPCSLAWRSDSTATEDRHGARRHPASAVPQFSANRKLESAADWRSTPISPISIGWIACWCPGGRRAVIRRIPQVDIQPLLTNSYICVNSQLRMGCDEMFQAYCSGHSALPAGIGGGPREIAASERSASPTVESCLRNLILAKSAMWSRWPTARRARPGGSSRRMPTTPMSAAFSYPCSVLDRRNSTPRWLPGEARARKPRRFGNSDFVVVANRLPVDLERLPDGTTTWKRSPGGLVTALEPLLRRRSGAWVGWPGVTDDVVERR